MPSSSHSLSSSLSKLSADAPHSSLIAKSIVCIPKGHVTGTEVSWTLGLGVQGPQLRHFHTYQNNLPGAWAKTAACYPDPLHPPRLSSAQVNSEELPHIHISHNFSCVLISRLLKIFIRHKESSAAEFASNRHVSVEKLTRILLVVWS